MKVLSQSLFRAAVVALATLAALGTARRSLADDLVWQRQRTASPAVYQEPIGGRIDETPNATGVVQTSAIDETGQPQQRAADTATEQKPPPRGTTRFSRTPQRQLNPRQGPAPWQSSPGRRVSYNGEVGPNGQPNGSTPWQSSPSGPRAAYDGQVRSSAAWQQQAPGDSGMEGPARRTAATLVSTGRVETISPEPEVIDSGTPVDSGMGMSVDSGMPVEGDGDEVVEGSDGFDNAQGGCCGAWCGPPCFGGRCPQCPPGCIPAPKFPGDFDIFAGVEGFKGLLDQGRNGNFGTQEGFNVGGPVWLMNNVGYQFGAEWVQSNFHGDQSTGIYQSDSRSQTFATLGLFSRANCCWPWQGGVAVDWLNDNYVVDYNVTQIRAELSRVFCGGTEIGFMGAFHATQTQKTFENDTNLRLTLEGDVTLRTADQYCLFVRRRFDNCGEGRIWGGATGEGEGLVGADYRIPISDSFLLQGNFNYLISREGGELGQQQDTWGISLELVFTPFCKARRGMSDPYRPLFGVADNSRMFLEPR